MSTLPDQLRAAATAEARLHSPVSMAAMLLAAADEIDRLKRRIRDQNDAEEALIAHVLDGGRL